MAHALFCIVAFGLSVIMTINWPWVMIPIWVIGGVLIYLQYRKYVDDAAEYRDLVKKIIDEMAKKDVV